MPLYPSVDGYRDQVDQLDQEAMNRPINQLRERTDYLRGRLNSIIGTGAFESVRLVDVSLFPDEPPAVNSFVYLETDTNTFAAATAEAITDGITTYQLATERAYSIGMLVESPGANIGTVAAYGKVDLSGILLADLLESGESFRAGPYYLSSSEPGKMTAGPKGPAIYLGFFLESKSSPGYGDFAILAPSAKDLWQSHSHFSYALASQPAGDLESTGATPADIHRIRGIKPDDYQPAGANDGNEPPYRMFLLGPWNGQGTPVYTIWVEAADDTTGTARVFWSTSDGSDDSYPGFDDPDQLGFDPDYGATIGRPVRAYEQPVAIGSKGLTVVFEKGYDSTLAAPDYDTQDFEAFDGTPALIERQWTVELPRRIRGWLPKWERVESLYTGTGTDPEYVLRLFGGYDNTGNLASESFRVVITSAGDFNIGTVDLEVYDSTDTLIASETNVGFGDAIDLGNGMWLQATRYTIDDVLAGTTTAALTDEWSFDFTDEAPGSVYQYHISMDVSLSRRYPPSPASAVVIEYGGIALPQRDFFGLDTGKYKPAPGTLHWYDNAFSQGPFPDDWETLADPGTVTVQMAIYLTKMALNTAGIVTSIKGVAPISVVDCNTGEPASTGDLQITADFSFTADDGNLAGFKVVKDVASDGTLRRGPIVEKILAGAGINVDSVNPTFPGQGTVRISFAGDGVTRGEFNDISLLNAKQELVPNRLFSFIKLLPFDSGSGSNVNTAFIAKFRVPQFLTGKYRIVVFSTIFGLDGVSGAQGTQWAGLTFTYNILQDLTNEGSPDTPVYVPRNLATLGASGVLERVLPLPDDVPFGIAGSGYTAYDPILLHNDESISELPGQITDPFTTYFPVVGEDPETVTAGDLVAVKFERSVPQDVAHVGAPNEYTGAMGFINLGWKLVEV